MCNAQHIPTLLYIVLHITAMILPAFGFAEILDKIGRTPLSDPT